MIDPSPQPSRPLRIFAHIARWSLGLMLAFWLVLAAAWGTLHGFIVPRIGEWRVQVERLASQAVGAPVRIDAVSAQSSSLFPTVHLQGVSVLDVQGREALKLQSVIATVSARSLLRLGLEQLFIEAPELDIRHLPDGRWQVAGLDMVQSDATESPALDWLLQLPELVIQKGKVLLTDEQRGMDAVQWRDVDVVLRNRHWSHVLRIDAVPADGSGDSMQLVGAFRQPLLPSSKAPWARWSGQWYASTQLRQVPVLPWPAAWGVQSIAANGMARVWVDVRNGQSVGMTADVALPQVRVVWQDTQISPLYVQQLQGRFEGQKKDQGWLFKGQNFTFEYTDGSVWNPSQWELETTGAWSAPRSVRLGLDHADMSMARKVVQTLPVLPSLRAAMERFAPEGLLRQLAVQWQSTGSYVASGQVEQLVVQPQVAQEGVGTPGVEGLRVAFSLNNEGGQAQLQMKDGALHFPGVFEEPRIPVQTLQAQLDWTVKDGAIQVEVPQAQFSNADAQGQLQAMWRTGDQEATRLPGYLQLQGQLQQANGARVHRYLPLEIPEVARHYVRDSVLQGEGRGVEFEVRGDLQHMPFDQAGTGRFYIKAPVHNVVYDFVPSSMQTSGEVPWPALRDVSGTLVFEGASMQVLQASTGFVGHPRLRMEKVQAQISDWNAPLLQVKAAGSTDLNAALGLVRQSPLAGLTSHALDDTQAQGLADIAFDLEVPIEDVEKTRVTGHVGFRKNGLLFNAQTPQLQQLQGRVGFHDQGFALQRVQGQTLGGLFRIEGGMPSLQQGVRLQARGQVTADGLQQDTQVPLLAQIAAHARGQASYAVAITAQNGAQQVTVRSDLRGMALALPAPLHKVADESLELRVEQSLSTTQEQRVQVEAKGRGWVSYVQDVAQTPSKVVRGRIMVGDAPLSPVTGEEVSADIQQAVLDVDAWLKVLPSREKGAAAVLDAEVQAWLPQRVHVNVGLLRIQGRELEQVQANLLHTAGTWRGSVKATHMAGRVEYREPNASDTSGRLFARFSRLAIPKSEAQRLNAEPAEADTAQVESLPALDIEVEQLEIAGKALGKLQLKARSSMGSAGREWILETFDLTMPEARWRAYGYWGSIARGVPRVTHLSFLLEMDSSGKLLERLGMPGVIRGGQGSLNGQISWQGAPITPDWNSMAGSVHMQVEKGQFLKVEPGIGKLLSVLSLQSLTRRMALDFRDVFSQGFAFDFVRGDVQVNAGLARTNNLQMKGLNAAVLMEGQANLVDETQDLTVVVVPEINAMTASLAVTAINPVVGLGSFLAQMFLRGPLMEAATRTFEITGSWTEPVVQQVDKQREPKSVPAEGETP